MHGIRFTSNCYIGKYTVAERIDNMELIWNEFKINRLIMRQTSQVELDRALTVPDGKTVSEIIDYSVKPLVTSCRIEGNKLDYSGEVTVQTVASSGDAKYFSFVTTAEFSGSIENEGLKNGMSIDFLPSIKSASLFTSDGTRLNLSAVIDIDFTVTCVSPIKALEAITPLSDLQLKRTQLQTSRRVMLANETIHLSEELSATDVDKILKSDLQISLRDVSMDTVSGMMQLNALCLNSDGELMQLIRSIPFKESVALNGSADEIYASAEIISSDVRSLGTEFSLVAVDADINIRIFGMRKICMDVPIDAYSPSLNFECLSENINTINAEGGACCQHSLKENLTLPEGYPDIFTTLNVSVLPVITNISIENGLMNVQGFFTTRLVYRSSDNSVNSFTDDVPFDINMTAPINAHYARLVFNAQACVNGGSGRTAQIAYNTDSYIEFMSRSNTDVVTGIAESCTPALDEGFTGGMVILSACDGETFFDVAKRFRVPLNVVEELNPETKEPFSNGDKVIIMF